MQHKQGEDRNQMFMFSLDSAIAEDSFVRVVDAFVEAIDLTWTSQNQTGFQVGEKIFLL